MAYYKIDRLAPVFVQVYNRKEHFVRCMESLAACRLAEHTHVFVASDAAKTEKDRAAVEEIRAYCRNLKGFARLDLLAPEHNLGAIESWQRGMDRVFSEYDTMIYTEDDNEFAPNFLEFMNDGLAFYKNDPRIFAICGFSPQIEMPENYPFDIYAYPGFSAWGTAHWREKYRAVDFSARDFADRMKDRQFARAYRRSFPRLCYYTMMAVARGKVVVGDMTIGYHCLSHGMFNIYPVTSVVRNLGWDGSGMHGGRDLKIMKQSIDTGLRPIRLIEGIGRSVIMDRAFFRWARGLTPLRQRVRQWIVYQIKRFIKNDADR